MIVDGMRISTRALSKSVAVIARYQILGSLAGTLSACRTSAGAFITYVRPERIAELPKLRPV